MLTKREPNGKWTVEGIDVTKVDPADFRSDSYEVKYMYKVFYTNKNGKQLYLLCETEEEAREMKLNLEVLGYKNVYRNIFIWQVLVEESE